MSDDFNFAFGPAALTSGTMTPYRAFELGWNAKAAATSTKPADDESVERQALTAILHKLDPHRDAVLWGIASEALGLRKLSELAGVSEASDVSLGDIEEAVYMRGFKDGQEKTDVMRQKWNKSEAEAADLRAQLALALQQRNQTLDELATAHAQLAQLQAPVGEKLPKWIDDLKGRDPLIDDLIYYIIGLNAKPVAPIGDSVDTPELRELVSRCFYAFTGDNLAIARAALITYITAWKDAQLAAQAQGEPRAWIWTEPASEWNGHQARERVTIEKPKPTEARLGCEPLYTTPIPKAQGEPVAWARKWHADGEKPEKAKNANGRLAWPAKFKFHPVTPHKIFGDDTPLYLGPASKADEMRDAALEEAAKVVETYAPSGGSKNYATAIRALKRTTAAEQEKP